MSFFFFVAHTGTGVCKKKNPVEKGRTKLVEKDRKTLFEYFAGGCSAFLGNFCPSLGNGVFDAEGA